MLDVFLLLLVVDFLQNRVDFLIKLLLVFEQLGVLVLELLLLHLVVILFLGAARLLLFERHLQVDVLQLALVQYHLQIFQLRLQVVHRELVFASCVLLLDILHIGRGGRLLRAHRGEERLVQQIGFRVELRGRIHGGQPLLLGSGRLVQPFHQLLRGHFQNSAQVSQFLLVEVRASFLKGRLLRLRLPQAARGLWSFVDLVHQIMEFLEQIVFQLVEVGRFRVNPRATFVFRWLALLQPLPLGGML